MVPISKIINTLFQRINLSYFLYQESELQDLADQLELRAKELKSQEAVLQTKVFTANCMHF